MTTYQTTKKLNQEINQSSVELQAYISELRADREKLLRLVSPKTSEDVVLFQVMLSGFKAYKSTPKKKRKGRLFDFYENLLNAIQSGQGYIKAPEFS